MGDLVRLEETGGQPRFPGALLLGDVDAELAREGAGGLGEREPRMLHQEGDDVAALLASEAVEDLSIGIDVEGGRLLGVERTEPAPVATGLLQVDIAPDQADDVGAASDLRNGAVGDPAQFDPFVGLFAGV